MKNITAFCMRRNFWFTVALTLLLSWSSGDAVRAAPRVPSLTPEDAQKLTQPPALSPSPLLVPSVEETICQEAEDTQTSSHFLPIRELTAQISTIDRALHQAKLQYGDPQYKKVTLPPTELLREKLLQEFGAKPTYENLEQYRSRQSVQLAALSEIVDKVARAVKAKLGLLIHSSKIRELLSKCAAERGRGTSIGVVATSAAAGISWQTAVVTGLANFVADRAQQELVRWLQEQLLRKLCEDPTGQLVFSNTCEAVRKINESPAALGRYFAAMIRKDLERLPALFAYVAIKQNYYSNDAPKAALLLTSLQRMNALIIGMKEGDSPLELVAALAQDAGSLGDTCKEDAGHLPCAVTLIGTWVKFLSTVRGLDKADFQNPETLTKLIRDILRDEKFYGALRTIYGRQDAVPAWLSPFLQKLLEKNASESMDKAVQAALETLNLDSDVAKATIVRRLFTNVSELEKRLRRIDDLQNKGTAFRAEWAADVTRMTLAVISSSVELLCNERAKSLQQMLQTLKQVVAALAAFSRGDYPEGLRATLEAVKPYVQHIPQAAQQFLPLLIDLAAAQTVEDVQAALSAAAAPMGSWRAKRQAPLTITVSALAGLSGGGEFPLSRQLSFTPQAGFAGGPLAALGLDLAWRVRGPQYWTLGMFVSVLDLGQLAYARVASIDGMEKSDTVRAKTASEVSFLSVLAPGTFLRVGAGNTPLTFGIGAAVAPQLRQYFITPPGGSESSGLFSMLRVMAFLAVDVTLSRIH